MSLAAAAALAAALLPTTASAAVINVPCTSENNAKVLQNAVLEANANSVTVRLKAPVRR